MGFDKIPVKNYKRHFICFQCQKGFKRPSENDLVHSGATDLSEIMNAYYDSDSKVDIVKYIEDAYQKIKAVCPNCKAAMVQVDYNFEVPPLRDNKAWKLLQQQMSSTIDISYDVYLHWHKLALEEPQLKPNKRQMLECNVTKLEKVILKD